MHSAATFSAHKTSKKRRSRSRTVEKLLYQEAGNRCAYCSDSYISHLTVHHIVPFADFHSDDPAAQIVLCRNCHSRADRGEISQNELFERKKALANQIHKELSNALGIVDRSYSRVFNIGQQNAKQILNVAGHATIRVPKKVKKIEVPAPEGSVSEQQLREIDDRAAAISRESEGKTSVGFIKRRIMQDFSVTAMRFLRQDDFPKILGYLRRFREHNRRDEPAASRRSRLLREVHAKASRLGFDHDKLSEECKNRYGCSMSNLSPHLLKDMIKWLEDR